MIFEDVVYGKIEIDDLVLWELDRDHWKHSYLNACTSETLNQSHYECQPEEQSATWKLSMSFLLIWYVREQAKCPTANDSCYVSYVDNILPSILLLSCTNDRREEDDRHLKDPKLYHST